MFQACTVERRFRLVNAPHLQAQAIGNGTIASDDSVLKRRSSGCSVEKPRIVSAKSRALGAVFLVRGNYSEITAWVAFD